MQHRDSNLSKAYSSQLDEITLTHPRIDGEIPKWLAGSFISNGPGQFEVGSTHFNHWFDGFAMLKKFDFQSGTVSFQNRFLHSKEYVESNALGRLNGNEFGTFAANTTLGRIRSSILGLIAGNPHDNCVVNTTRIGENYIAMTEGNDLISFNIHDLETTGAFKFLDAMPGHLMLAHPHWDSDAGELINISIEVGQNVKYHVYKVDPMSKMRQPIQTYSSDRLFYIHSFSITNHYVILLKTPLVMNKYKLILGLPFNDTLSYQDHASSFFVIINRKNGQITEVETDPFVCLHTVNAYEHGNELIIDLVCHSSGNPYDKLYLSNLRSIKPSLPLGEIRRYLVHLNSKKCHYLTTSEKMHEFPRINYIPCNGANYQFVYTNCITHPDAPFLNAIQKLNIQTGKAEHWKKRNYYLGEAVFVPGHASQLEDEGVLISIAFDASTLLSSLLIIDAQSMSLLAEIFLPLHLPFGLHGNFYQ